MARLGVNDRIEQTWESALYPQLVSKPKRLHLCEAATTVAISPSKALPWSSPHRLTCVQPLLLPSYHPRSSQQPEGKGVFYLITALLTALQGSCHI